LIKKIMIKIKTIITTTMLLLFLMSCQSVKDGLTGKKTNNTDEFLIKKKNPLVLPPEFEKLPEPRDTVKKEEEDIFNILKIVKKDQKEIKNIEIEKSESLEKSILKKINKE
tara:strand:+ start:811 stop:1143 length:333 start_codon:yes stop_codon:yes gene_type:complete